MKPRFAGHVALVTGGGTGIGAATAARLREEGAHVYVLGRREAPLNAVAEAFGAIPLVADAADPVQVRHALACITDHHGRLDVVVANAGGFGFGAIGQTADDDWRRACRANLDTAFVVTREALPRLIESHGTIVVVSSIAGLAAGPEAAGYVTVKHALIGLTRSLARDYGRHGVRTNAVCPGWVRTEMADDEMRTLMSARGLSTLDDAYALATRDVPLGHAAEAGEIASVIAFLASDDASAMNGAVVVADGGATIVDVPTLAFAEPATR
ncbi:SDR family oxidoreductase [uncultured Ralstonia sp.]|jgi:meso-butanediol dehydrogenase/(S,S)-butanediol dehydrogenase/diacetyl reductase|uniref:SDR family NAD(P)-dependent oxidoreductase n=1 Tax=Ralstonia sp. TaxID=54061 RepID=UPI001EA4D020|nr:SDR family oxidoreductase [uncultured Ralstonia sp.]UCF26274.1 MAG: SDR family oxidoreductase [Ralstonia sp.]